MKRALLVPVAFAALFGCSPEVTQSHDAGMGQGGSGQGGSGDGGSGQGGSGQGGSPGLGGETGQGGMTGAGGMVGTGGRGMGGAGMGGAGMGGAGGGMTDDAAQVKADLEMAGKWLLPCGQDQSYSLLVCQNNPPTGGCRGPSATVPYLTAGTINLDKTVTVRGTPGKTYTVTARIQGVVEPKHYQNGVNTTATTCTGTPNNNCGWYVGGAPQTNGNYNVYMMWVSAPAPTPTTGLQGQYFFLNNINKTEAHFSYPIDYQVTFQINGGAMVRFLADDSNCSAIKNCDTTSVDTVPGGGGRCNPITVPNMVATAAGAVTQPYNGQFIVMSIVSIK